MNDFHSWRARSIRTILAVVTASSLMVSGAVFAVAASAVTGPATQLVVTTQPSNAQSGVALGTQPQVSIEDASGNVVTSDSSTVVAQITSPGVGTIAGGSVSAVNGVATFSGLKIDALVGTYTLTFTDVGLTSAVSNPFVISVGPATKLAVTTQPSSGEVSGTALVTQPVVKTEDSGGNVVTSATGTVTVTSGCTISSGATSVALVSGVALFSGLTMTASSGAFCTLTFADSPLTPATSNAVLMSNAATQLVITQQPSNVQSGVAFSPTPKVTIEDANSTPVKSSTATVTATITSGTGTLTNATAVAVEGVATFTGLALNGLVGSYTITFSAPSLTSAVANAVTVAVGPAAKLAITTQPSTSVASGVALAIQPVVKIVDSGGNPVTTSNATITATFTSGGVSITNPTATTSSGVATFTGMALNALVGYYTLTFSAPSLTSVVSNTVYVGIGAATKLAITTQPPANVATGVAFVTQPVVKIVDSGGNVITSNYTAVTATVTSGTYVLSNATVTAVAGTATFSGMALYAPVGSYTLTFRDGTLTPAVSTTLSVTSGAPTHLVITTQPSPTQASGVPLAVVPVVKVEDVAATS